MPRALKFFYEASAYKPRGVVARHADGRPATQVRRAFLAASFAEAVRTIDRRGWDRAYIKKWVQVGDIEKAPPGIPFGEHEPGTVLIAPLDPGDTIDGTEGWRPYLDPWEHVQLTDGPRGA